MGPGHHFSPARALVPAPAVPQTCLPLILSPGTLISCTSLGHGLLPCHGQHRPAATTWVPGPPAPSCGTVLAGEVMVQLPCSHLPWECSPTPAAPWHFPSCCIPCQISIWSFRSWSVGRTCWWGPRSGIKACVDFQHTQVVSSFLLTSSSLCSKGWLLKFLILPRYSALWICLRSWTIKALYLHPLLSLDICSRSYLKKTVLKAKPGRWARPMQSVL